MTVLVPERLWEDELVARAETDTLDDAVGLEDAVVLLLDQMTGPTSTTLALLDTR